MPVHPAQPLLVLNFNPVSAGIINNLVRQPGIVFQIGKPPGQPLAATSVAGLLPSRLFYIIDHSSNLNFLVDTGAEVSVIPPTGKIDKMVSLYRLLTTPLFSLLPHLASVLSL